MLCPSPIPDYGDQKYEPTVRVLIPSNKTHSGRRQGQDKDNCIKIQRVVTPKDTKVRCCGLEDSDFINTFPNTACNN
eukprot:scaffold3988_cov162-Amphora_coffeaeformis.AAC.5